MTDRAKRGGQPTSRSLHAAEAEPRTDRAKRGGRQLKGRSRKARRPKSIGLARETTRRGSPASPRIGTREKHTKAERARELALCQPCAFIHQLAVHQGNLSGGPAKGQKAYFGECTVELLRVWLRHMAAPKALRLRAEGRRKCRLLLPGACEPRLRSLNVRT